MVIIEMKMCMLVAIHVHVESRNHQRTMRPFLGLSSTIPILAKVI